MNKAWYVVVFTLMMQMLIPGAILAQNMNGNPWMSPENQAGQGAVTVFQFQYGQESSETPPANAQVGPAGDCVQNQFQTCTQNQSEVQYENMLQEQSQLMTQSRIGQENSPVFDEGIPFLNQQRACEMNCTAAMTSLQNRLQIVGTLDPAAVQNLEQNRLQQFQQYHLQQMTNYQIGVGGGAGLLDTTLP
jgi:hypothetical protein